MPIFQYTAFDRAGRLVSGSMEAPDNAAVRAKLARGRYEPGTITPLHTAVVEPERAAMPFEAGPPAAASVAPRLPVSVPARDLAGFYTQMAAMARAGVPLVAALMSVRNHTTNGELHRALADMEAAASFGRPLSEAMDRHPRAFGRGHVGLVRMGEGTGRLQQALESLAEQARADWSVEAATRFNPLLFCVRWMLGPFVLFFALGANSAAFVSVAGPAILALLGVTAYPLLRKTSRWSRLGTRLDDFLSRLPVLGARSARLDRVRAAGALAAALDAGVSTSLAWELAAETPDSAHRRHAMGGQQRGVTRGGLISDALEASGVFDASYVEAARSGELTGNLPETLWRALQYDKREAALFAELTPWLVGFVAYMLYLIVGSYAVLLGWGAAPR